MPGKACAKTLSPPYLQTKIATLAPLSARVARFEEGVDMNTANLQLEGLYVVLSALLVALREKGVFENDELELRLNRTEARLASDPERMTLLRDSNVEAICFPARYLRQALQTSASDDPPSFTELATRVGQGKRAR